MAIVSLLEDGSARLRILKILSRVWLHDRGMMIRLNANVSTALFLTFDR